MTLPPKKQKLLFFIFFFLFLTFLPQFCIYNIIQSDVGDRIRLGNRSWDQATTVHAMRVRNKGENKKIKATLIIHPAAAQPQRPRRSRNKYRNNGWMGGLKTVLDGRVSHPTSLRDGVGAPDRSFFFCRKAKNNGILLTKKSTFLQSQP